MGRTWRWLGTSADGERGHEIGKPDEGSGHLLRAIYWLAYFVARIDHICFVSGGNLRGCRVIQWLGYVGCRRGVPTIFAGSLTIFTNQDVLYGYETFSAVLWWPACCCCRCRIYPVGKGDLNYIVIPFLWSLKFSKSCQSSKSFIAGLKYRFVPFGLRREAELSDSWFSIGFDAKAASWQSSQMRLLFFSRYRLQAALLDWVYWIWVQS